MFTWESIKKRVITTKIGIVAATGGKGRRRSVQGGCHRSSSSTVLVMFYFISWVVSLLFIRLFF